MIKYCFSLPALVFSLILLCSPAPLVGQEHDDDLVLGQAKESVELDEVERSQRLKSLSTVLASRHEVEKDLRAKQALLGTDAARGRENKILSEIAKLQSTIDSLDQNFSVVATTIETDEFKEEPKQFSWAREAKELLEPLISEIKRLTSRPREINQLRTDLETYRNSRDQADYALANIEALSGNGLDKELSAALKDLRQEWSEKRQSSLTSISVLRQKLNRKLSERKSLVESVTDVSQIFFRSRGRNLFVAILATVLFWISVRFLQRRFDRFGSAKTLSTRLMHVLFFLAYALGTLGVFVFVLFVFGDWVLLILAMLVIVGLIWASK
ncbi:MAG: hypothetical protein KDD62_12250, partial [Bdellovibrionales bacterium]|nr:hypothetical protein [Bdellovibrionales bacterium]